MNDLAARILVLQPLADFATTCQLVDHRDSLGPRIAHWDASLGPQPTREQLEAVTQEQIDALPERVAARNESTIRTALDAEIAAITTEAASLDNVRANWASMTNAQKLQHVDILTRNQARIGRDMVRLVRLMLRRLEEA